MTYLTLIQSFGEWHKHKRERFRSSISNNIALFNFIIILLFQLGLFILGVYLVHNCHMIPNLLKIILCVLFLIPDIGIIFSITFLIFYKITNAFRLNNIIN